MRLNLSSWQIRAIEHDLLKAVRIPINQAYAQTFTKGLPEKSKEGNSVLYEESQNRGFVLPYFLSDDIFLCEPIGIWPSSAGTNRVYHTDKLPEGSGVYWSSAEEMKEAEARFSSTVRDLTLEYFSLPNFIGEPIDFLDSSYEDQWNKDFPTFPYSDKLLTIRVDLGDIVVL